MPATDQANKAQDPLHGLRGVAEFREVLYRERAQSDRTEKAFTLILVSGKQSPSDSRTAVLAKAISDAGRVIDVVGWFDRGRIGIILPDTSAEGAWKLAQRLARSTYRVLAVDHGMVEQLHLYGPRAWRDGYPLP